MNCRQIIDVCLLLYAGFPHWHRSQSYCTAVDAGDSDSTDITQGVMLSDQHAMCVQADHKDVEQLKTQAAASAPAPRQSPLPAQSAMLACQGCSAVQEAFQSLQMQLQAKELASGRGSTKASSAPSTQDHSGDTHDDRCAGPAHAMQACPACCPKRPLVYSSWPLHPISHRYRSRYPELQCFGGTCHPSCTQCFASGFCQQG